MEAMSKEFTIKTINSGSYWKYNHSKWANLKYTFRDRIRL